jgi:hypothetical protein
VELIIVILVEMLKIFAFLTKHVGMGNSRVPVYPHGYGYGDDLLPVGGYDARYGYWFTLLGTSLGRQNPWVLYPLTSLPWMAARAQYSRKRNPAIEYRGCVGREGPCSLLQYFIRCPMDN